MLKAAKAAVLKAEKDWNLVFTVKKWDDFLPKDVVVPQDALAAARAARPKSLDDKRGGPLAEEGRARVFTSDGAVDSRPSQVEFLYALWEKENKQKPPTLKSLKPPRQPSIQEGADRPKPPAEEGSLGVTQASFYQISHPRNKVTNSYNYVLRKTNLQFVCRQKENEGDQKPADKPLAVQPSIDDALFKKSLPPPPPQVVQVSLPVKKVELNMDGLGPARPAARPPKNAKLAKLDIK